ncbi:alpha/beta-hydrolase [Epithele typhae]|uniref:alpha/beta-hydrolase n=1 Tax=Epithele typhae TaxID=378194 RepID=UPI002007AFCF|nr:alpha/beta-hydrolase [Epithele typhae]KAH9945052.1 alpha/beta-hydrolase [Epithele typhae]
MTSTKIAEETPFEIAVPDADIELLKKKLELARFPDELEGADWSYGAPLADIKRLVSHWKDGFDWRKHEAKINELPMFTRDIDVDAFGTLNIHYVHQQSDVKNAIPLLFVHGWPGHFLEVEKMLPMLTAASPDHPSFHVVAPSLPGYGFSEGAHKPGFKAPQYAELFNKLMVALGYNEYVYQGGDWGGILGKAIVPTLGPKHIKAWHTNMPIMNPPTLLRNPLLFLQMLLTPFNKTIREGFEYTQRFVNLGSGYSKMHMTKPQTIGYSLADSPVGLLAWIYEKLVAWTDEYPWTDDEVLRWISIYYFSRAGPAASVRIYYEMSEGGTATLGLGHLSPATVPTGVSYFPGELIRLPKSWAALMGKTVYVGEHDKGGHFAAFEVPEVLAGDMFKMYGKGGGAFGVVPGKSGYD